jgi:hypothetical protein
LNLGRGSNLLIAGWRLAGSLLHFAYKTRKYRGDIWREKDSEWRNTGDIPGRAGGLKSSGSFDCKLIGAARNRLAGRRQSRLPRRACEAASVSIITAHTNMTDTKECFMSKTVYVRDEAATPDAITLEVEEVEDVIVPGITLNHNQTLVSDEVELNAEDAEEVIAPAIASNHNETLAIDEVELNAEEVEEVIAPKIAVNHNESLVSDEVELNAEEIEEVIAPKLAANHNETMVSDEVELNVEEMEETLTPTPSIPIPPPFRNH